MEKNKQNHKQSILIASEINETFQRWNTKGNAESVLESEGKAFTNAIEIGSNNEGKKN